MAADPYAVAERAAIRAESRDAETEAPPPGFRCRNPYCLHKGRWWRSVYGVVRCLNCRPPAVPELVAETGEEAAP